MCKRRRILQPKLPLTVFEFDELLKYSQHYTNHLKTVSDNEHVVMILDQVAC